MTCKCGLQMLLESVSDFLQDGEQWKCPRWRWYNFPMHTWPVKDEIML